MDPIVVDPKQKTEEKNSNPTLAPESTTALTPDSPAVPPTPAAPVPGSLPPKRSRKNLLLIIVLLVLAVLGGVFAYIKVNKTRPGVTADQSQKEIAELRLGTSYTPFNKVYPDPNFLAAGSWATTVQLYEGLVGFENGNSIVPLLAQSWTNPDPNTWVFRLKENVKFHNGKTLTAEDVKASIDRALADPNTIPLLISSIDSVNVIDAQNVQIKTKEPDAILLNKLLFLYIQGEEKLNGLVVGTGAYRVTDGFDPNATEKEMRLVAFDDYHSGRPAVRTVTFIGFDDDEQMTTAVKEGKIDITDLYLRTANSAEDIAGYVKTEQADGFISYLGINTADTKSPLNKLKVRQALRLAIDPQAFITNTNRPGVPASQITMQLNFGYNPELKPITRDVTKAKELLKEAGYPNGVTLKLTYSDSEGNQTGFEELKKQAAEAGITLTADVTESFNDLSDKINAGGTQVYNLSSASAFIDSYDLFAYNFQNENFKNSTFDDLLTRSNAAFNADERKKLLQEVSKLLVDEVAAIPLVESTGVYYVRDNLNYNQDLGFALPGDYIKAISAK